MTIEYREIDRILGSLPEVLMGKGIIQNNEHEFDVYHHTIAVVNVLKEMEASKELVAAGYLHDIGKSVIKKSAKKNNSLVTIFQSHEIIGSEIIKKMNSKIFQKLQINQNEIALIVKFHYYIMKNILNMKNCLNKNDFYNTLNNLNYKLDCLPIKRKDLLDFFYADKKGQGKTKDFDFLFALLNYLCGDSTNYELLFDMMKRTYR